MGNYYSLPFTELTLELFPMEDLKLINYLMEFRNNK